MLNVTKRPNGEEVANGVVLNTFKFDQKIKLTLKEVKRVKGYWKEDKKFIDNKSLCGILDNSLWEVSENARKSKQRTLCPIPVGIYPIINVNNALKKLNVPYDMLGNKAYKVEFRNDKGEALACKIITFEANLSQSEQTLD